MHLSVHSMSIRLIKIVRYVFDIITQDKSKTKRLFYINKIVYSVYKNTVILMITYNLF